MLNTLFEVQTDLKQAFTYLDYKALAENLLEKGMVTGPNQSEDLLEYGKLNAQRFNRIEKHVELLDATKLAFEEFNRKVLWLIIAESWCGDVAQNLPIIYKMAQLKPAFIDLKIILRDEHLELMDRYLTNGGRSIPKLICFDAASGEELFTWGPRPQFAQDHFLQLKAQGIEHKEAATQLHAWYAKDKTQALQAEFVELIKSCI